MASDRDTPQTEAGKRLLRYLELRDELPYTKAQVFAIEAEARAGAPEPAGLRAAARLLVGVAHPSSELPDRFIVHRADLDALRAALAAPEPPDTGSMDPRIAVARAVATIWRDDYLRFMKESPDTQWAVGTHPLSLVLAALDGETDPVQLGVSPHRLAARLRESAPRGEAGE